MAVKLDVSFNGMSLSEKFGIGLLSYQIQSATSRKTRGVDIPGRHGMYKVKSAYSSKSITLSVVVEATTSGEVHKKIRTFLSWLSYQDEPKIIFTDNPDVFVKADLDSSSEYYVTRGVDNAMTYLTIELYQYDPFTYDNGIMSYNLKCVPGESYDVLNEGIDTPYIIRLSGIENNSTQYMSTSLGHNTLALEDGSFIASDVTLIVNGVKQLYRGTLSHKDVLEIDSEKLTITKNGESVITDWEGDINDLVYGNNTFIISNLENVNLNMTVEYYRRWL